MTACRAAQKFPNAHVIQIRIRQTGSAGVRTFKREIRGEGFFCSLGTVLNRNPDVFSKHKAVIRCCNFIEHEKELEEGAICHRKCAGRVTPHKSEAFRERK